MTKPRGLILRMLADLLVACFALGAFVGVRIPMMVMGDSDRIVMGVSVAQ